VPTAQLEHADIPVLDWKVPSAQFEHVVPPVIAEYFPESHLMQDELPDAAEYVPVPHVEHAPEELDPLYAWYFPLGQDEQKVLPLFC